MAQALTKDGNVMTLMTLPHRQMALGSIMSDDYEGDRNEYLYEWNNNTLALNEIFY